MLGILGALMFIGSAIDQKSAEIEIRRRNAKAGNKYYTDSHGNQRDVRTDKIVPITSVIPAPPKSTGKEKYKIVKVTRERQNNKYVLDRLPCIPGTDYFDRYSDAFDYKIEKCKNTETHIYKIVRV